MAKSKHITDQELRDLVAETSRKVDEVGRQIGWIGNTFGRFTEGPFMPSLEKILEQDFGLDTIAPRIQSRQNGSFVELDVLGYSNSEKNMAVVVEIKSTLRDADIKNFVEQLKNFPKLFPEHKDKKLFGIIAAVGITIEQKNFKPKDFGLKA